MPTAKEEVRDLLEKIPDDSTFEDIQYHIYLREKIRKALDDVEAGRVLTQDEAEARMDKWLAE